ncbi:hypothetical protein P4B35_05110 [Pontiellaceae bacterium B12227]|nr:hypothetical protein [Pontiellaceae bacterium B12227]
MLCLVGCSTIPFEADPKGDFRGLESDAVLADFSAKVGTEFELLESVVFKFFTKGFTGLGYLSVNPAEESYALSCMTPTGVSIFGLQGRGEDVEPLFVPPQMEKHQDKIFAAIGADLRRVYLDWLPPADAEVKVKKDRMIFKADGSEWIFSGLNRRLTEKRFSRGWKTDAIATYYNYEELDGKLYPKGVVLYNKRFHYRIIFHVKEIYSLQDSE